MIGAVVVLILMKLIIPCVRATVIVRRALTGLGVRVMVAKHAEKRRRIKLSQFIALEQIQTVKEQVALKIIAAIEGQDASAAHARIGPPNAIAAWIDLAVCRPHVLTPRDLI